jgi:tRNA (guanine37-N1)-methyltransferase
MPHVPERDASRPPRRAAVLTLFPELFPGPLGISLAGHARDAGIWTLDTIPIRNFGLGKHRQVDDTPAGGGAGMVLRADVLGPALDHARARSPNAPLIYLSPRGTPLTQPLVRDLAEGPGVTLLAGRFEGIDERVIEAKGLKEISIGDYVLAGGELAAMVLIEACVRLLPGVIGAAESLANESFETGLLEHPQYAKPRDWEGRSIPGILLTGDHKKIEEWRRREAERLTAARRPELLSRRRRTSE